MKSDLVICLSLLRRSVWEVTDCLPPDDPSALYPFFLEEKLSKDLVTFEVTGLGNILANIFNKNITY